MDDLTQLEYPRYVHKPSHHGQWRDLKVDSLEACKAALADGWSLTPVVVPDGEPIPKDPPKAASAKAETSKAASAKA